MRTESFKKATVYRFKQASEIRSQFSQEAFSEKLSEMAITELEPSQMSKTGWTQFSSLLPDDSLALFSSDHIFIRQKTSQRDISKKAVTKLVDERVAAKEQLENRKVGRKEKQEIKEQVIIELKPNSPIVDTFLTGLISLEHGYLIVDTAKNSDAEIFTALLRKTVGSLPIVPFYVGNNVSYEFGALARGEIQQNQRLKIGDSGLLRSKFEDQAEVRIKNINLDEEEVIAHLDGKEFHEMSFKFLGEPDEDNYSIPIADVRLDRKLVIKKLSWAGVSFAAEATDDELADMVGELEVKARSLDELLEIVNSVFSIDNENI